jgi:hypothetical protein
MIAILAHGKKVKSHLTPLLTVATIIQFPAVTTPVRLLKIVRV